MATSGMFGALISDGWRGWKCVGRRAWMGTEGTVLGSVEGTNIPKDEGSKDAGALEAGMLISGAI